MDSEGIILVGTSKGLLAYEIIKGAVSEPKIYFSGFSVNLIFADPRNGRWWAGLSHKHWGQKLHYSDDKGFTWREVAVPAYDGAMLNNDRPAKLRQIWCMSHGGTQRPSNLWLGTEPGGLFLSRDSGENWELVRGLWNHPSRLDASQWFATSSEYPFIHSVVVDPKDPDHVYVAVSCAGVFETTDGGKTWEPRNNGLKAAYLPNPEVEIGHDPHILLMSTDDNMVLWQQNHCGVFRSTDGGAEWLDISSEDGLPSYGFCMAIDEKDIARAWVIPVKSDEERVPPGLSLKVMETRDAGNTWRDASDGLPKGKSFDIVLRRSFSRKGNIMAFGTTSGNLFFSTTDQPSWRFLSMHLAKVNCVEVIIS